MIFFTGDTHFGHFNIIKYSNRPFTTVEEMDKSIIDNINNEVDRKDELYHLGDWSFGHSSWKKYRDRINCQHIHLILGNHDGPLRTLSKSGGYIRKYFASVQEIKEIRIDNQDIVLFHYAMRTWNRSFHGSWHLFGHSHGKLPDNPASLSFDVGVDCHNYAPISFDQVREIMKCKHFVPQSRGGMDDSVR